MAEGNGKKERVMVEIGKMVNIWNEGIDPRENVAYVVEFKSFQKCSYKLERRKLKG